jgi:anti-sigma factor RsiW
VLTCLLSRRRLGAYLDGALEGGASRAIEAHLGSCPRCQREAAGLQRLRAALQGTLLTPPDPDWTAFWPGIVRGIQDARRAPAAAARSWRWSPRWAARGAALAAASALSLVLWYAPWSPGSDESVVVTSADTQYPGGAMVYHTPDRVAVVWVFDE